MEISSKKDLKTLKGKLGKNENKSQTFQSEVIKSDKQ